MERAVFCIVDRPSQAHDIVHDLKGAGFSSDDVSVLLPARTRMGTHQPHTKAPEGAAAGATSGGALGGVLGWLVGAGSLAIPGLGPFVAAGPILSAVSGAAAGATAGGLIGALVGMGIPEYEATRFEERIRDGNILISVHTRNRDERYIVKDILAKRDAQDIRVGCEGDAE